MLPIRDRNPTTRRPVVTLALIVACIAVYFLVQARPGTTDVVAAGGQRVEIESSLRFSLEYAAVPCEVVHERPLTVDEVTRTFNDNDATACANPAAGPALFPGKQVLLAVVTSIFLHGGLLHLGGNMLFLWIFGNNIEDRLGHARYLAFYLVAGVVAAAAHIAVQPASTVPVVGASGAIAGVMGAYLVWFPRARVTTLVFVILVLPVAIEARWLLLFWFVSQFFTAPGSGVAWTAHVAGFAFGIVVALVVRRSERARAVVWHPDRRAAW